MAEKWPRDLWLDAIWEDQSLKPNERAVAYTYARYAGKGDTSWCSWDELRRRTGIKSRDAIWRAVTGLVDGGWLRQVDAPRQHRSAVYRMTCSLPSISDVRETDDCRVLSGESVVRENVASSPGFCDQPSVSRTPLRQIERSEERTDARVSARSPSGAQPTCLRCRGRRYVTVSPGCMDDCPDCVGEAA